MPTRHMRTLASAKAEPAAALPATTPAARAAQGNVLWPGSLGRSSGHSAQAQVAALHRASGGQLARVGAALLQLQSQYGNRHMQQVISHARAAPAPVVQAKLVLGPASDRYEREADAVAARLAGHAPSPVPAARRRAGDDGRFDLRQPGEDGRTSGRLLHGAAGGAIDAAAAQALGRARGGGQSLPATLRRSMELALGADLGGVRVHTGSQSDRLTRSLQAAAVTSGQDIFFRRGTYAPASAQGTALLAHELTHVVQQRAAPSSTVQRFFDPPADPRLPVRKPRRPRALGQQAPHVSKSPGWAISKEVAPATEMLIPQGNRIGYKVTRFTALLTPGHHGLGSGGATQPGVDPLGWKWVERNELRTTSNKLRYWVRFHLLNDKLGGKGSQERHLVPTTKTANSQWNVKIERPMAAALQNGLPVYYDVQLTYWNHGDAPATYQDTNAGRDYRPNIELFPRSIEGNWQHFQKTWLPHAPVIVAVDKPRGIQGEDADVTTYLKLDKLAEMFNIDERILRGLRWHANKGTQFTTYRDVRQVLEDWAMKGGTDQEISDRYQAIYVSDGYLRTALAGGQSFSLNIRNQHIPDDLTPEAKPFGPTVNVADYLHNTEEYQQAGGPISIAYRQAQQTEKGPIKSFPAFEEFLWKLMTEGDLLPVPLSSVGQRWETFKAANKLMPPVRDAHLVPEQDEIFFVLERRTKQPVVDWVRNTYTQRISTLTNGAGATGVADELANAVAADYGDLLRRGFPGLTVEHAAGVPRLAQALLALDPVRPLAAELDARLAVAPDMLTLKIASKVRANPFSQPLTDSLAGEMGQQVAAEQQRIAAVLQRRPPPDYKAPPARRNTMPSMHSPQPGSGVRKPDPYVERFLRTLRNEVRADPRYQNASAAQQAVFRRRTEAVEDLWSRPVKYLGRLDEDLEIAFRRIF